MEKKGRAIIMGDYIYAGIDEDDIIEIKNGLVISFDDAESMGEALRSKKIEFYYFDEQ